MVSVERSVRPRTNDGKRQIRTATDIDADRLRHSKFIGLREDKDPRSAVKEHSAEN
jgi:hypothetical protein